jgi:POT family proton-dependent oligopeptide transporter
MATSQTLDRHPPQLKILFFTEMWERFGFYLMLGILPLYLSDREKGGIGWDDGKAAVVVGTYIALVYLTPFIGGILADRIFGFRKTIVAGAFLMMVGYLMLGIPARGWSALGVSVEGGLYLALLVIILGNGAFKPNISTLLGRLYPPGSPLKDAGYNIFYMGINIGAFICNFVAALVRNFFDDRPQFGIVGWNAAFCTAGIGMLFGLLIFSVYYRRFTDVDIDPRTATGPKPSLNPLWFGCLLPALLVGVLGWLVADLGKNGPLAKSLFQLTDPLYDWWPFSPVNTAFLAACIPVIVFFVNVWRGLTDQQERNRTASLLVIYSVIIVFWMTFHLNTTALNFFARDNTHRVPNRAIQLVTDQFPEFAENAPPKYFNNAGPATPRPDKQSFLIVSEEKYKQLAKENKLWDIRGDGQERQVFVHVTQPMLDRIYARVDPETEILPKGEPLKLVNTELFQSINAGQVVLFTPLVVGFFAWLRRRNLEPSTPGKMGLGLIINAGAPLVMFIATWASDNSFHKVSAWWLIGTYAVATLGELCLSPMGLSLVSKVSPPQITAFMMGGYFLTTSIGNKLSGIFGEVYTKLDHYHNPAPDKLSHYEFWLILVGCNLFFGLCILALLRWLKRQMGESLH